VCDSIKRHLDPAQRAGIQGEYGIGLLSFWTLGEELILTSAGADGRTYEMRTRKGNPSYTVSERRRLFAEKGAEVTVQQLMRLLSQVTWKLNGKLVKPPLGATDLVNTGKRWCI
jgi:hypothetical protein